MKLTLGRLRRIIDHMGFCKAQEIDLDIDKLTLRYDCNRTGRKESLTLYVEHGEKGEEVKSKLVIVDEDTTL